MNAFRISSIVIFVLFALNTGSWAAEQLYEPDVYEAAASTDRIQQDSRSVAHPDQHDDSPHPEELDAQPLDEEYEDAEEPIERKDSRVPETNEINPYKLFPPQFHALLDIPIHDYGNGTTYNPHDKFKPKKVVKTPLVSDSYSNTRNQGFTSTTVKPETTTHSPQYHDYDYDYDPSYGHKTTKTAKRPKTKPTTRRPVQTTTTRKPRPKQKIRTTTTTQATVDYDEETYYQTTRRPVQYVTTEDYYFESEKYHEPQYETKTTKRPSYRPQNPAVPTQTSYRPEYHQTDDGIAQHESTAEGYDTEPYVKPAYRPVYSDDKPPVYVPQSYDKGTAPNPYYSTHDEHHQAPVKPVEHEHPETYDYDDERNKGTGAVYPYGDHVNIPQSTPPPRYTSYSSTPAYGKYNQQQVQPQPEQQFRPSVPLDTQQGSDFTPRPETSRPGSSQVDHEVYGGKPRPVQTQYFGPIQQPNHGLEQPRPPFLSKPAAGFPQQQQQPYFKEGDNYPSGLPSFRPNSAAGAGVNEEIQASRPTFQPVNQREPQRRPPPPGGIRPFREPLPSALQSPFAQISQAVANFFGRRSSNHRSRRSANNLKELFSRDPAVEPNSNSPIVFYTRPHEQVDRSGSDNAPVQQLVGIQSTSPVETPQGQQPPAFYVYTSERLQKGEPPYLVVGPQRGPPPAVVGAKLVHAVPAVPMPQETERRHDLPVDGVRLDSPNALPQPSIPSRPATGFRRPFPLTPTKQQGVHRPTIKDTNGFTPVAPPVHSKFEQPPHRPLAPPANPPAGSFRFPADSAEVAAVAYVPNASPSLPPRVPLNPEKDVASLHFESTPFHQPAPVSSGFKKEHFIDEGFKQPIKVLQYEEHHSIPIQAVEKTEPSPSIPTADFSETERPQLLLDSALPLMKIDSKPFVLPEQTEPETTTTTATTKATTTTTTSTTPATYGGFMKEAPVKYSTIQQEDGKQIAVVLPAYIVTYRPKPGSTDFDDIDSSLLSSDGVGQI